MNLINDLATITTIPATTLKKLAKKEELCILHAISENEFEGIMDTSIDIGFGTIFIRHDGDELKYGFIPSKSFEEDLKETITTGVSPLITEVETALKNKVMNTYKDLF